MRPVKHIYSSFCDSKTLMHKYIHTHTHKSKGEVFRYIISRGRSGSLPYLLHIHRVSLLPPGFGEDNEGASAAFEGCFDCTDSYCL